MATEPTEIMRQRDAEVAKIRGFVDLTEEAKAAYEAIWDTLPELRAAQDAGTPTYCPECGRQLTFGEGEGSR